MSQIVVRNLDSRVHQRLRTRAEQNGRSMEEEVRQILRAAVREEKKPRRKLGSEAAALFGPLKLREAFPEVRGWGASPAEFGDE